MISQKCTALAMLAVLLFSCQCGQGLAAVPATPQHKAVRRLPDNVAPQSYDIHLSPDLETGKFSGVETVTFKITEPGTTEPKTVLMHANDLKIEEALLIDSPSAVPAKINMLPADQMVSFVFPATVAAGEHHLKIKFTGKLNEKLVGFYRSTFKDSHGTSQTLAVTQFEPTDARRMFPCFDEPQLKARFKLHVRTKNEFAAISNAALEKTTPDGKTMKIVDFAETSPMSTYLVALIVGPLESTEPIVVDGVPVRSWSVPGKAALGLYARDEAVKLLPIYNNYFKIPYPWKKLDLIAIPDFEAGAMENPAAITFRQTMLLVDPKSSASHSRRSVTSVLAHEMAHMWFGDLVTMKWWDDLWLNEAFATFMSIKAVDLLHPDWQFWKDYAETRLAALSTDALHSTRAIHSEVLNPEQAHEMFDVITYEKGSSVLRMLERYVREDLFQEGIHQYLEKHSFANATTADLWSAIAVVSGKPVQDIMQGWVHQPGYPLVTVEQGQTKDTAQFSQARFFADASRKNGDGIWQIPIGLRVLKGVAQTKGQSEPDTTVLLTSGHVESAMPSFQAPYVANAGGVGYFRVRYPQSLFTTIAGQATTALDPSERLGFLGDAWALANNGTLPVEDYLNLLTQLRGQTDELVWGTIIEQLNELDHFVSDAARPAYQRMVRAELSPLKDKLGWQTRESDTQQVRILRGWMLSTLGTVGQDQSVIAKARQLFNQGLKLGKPFDRELSDPVTDIVAYNGGPSEYAEFLKLRATAKTPDAEIRNLFALPNFRQPALTQRTMAMAIDGTVKTQDAPRLLGNLLASRESNQQAWQFIKKNWVRIRAFYPEEMVPHVVAHASSFHTPEMVQELQTFFASHPVPSGESSIARMLERTKINTSFSQRSGKAMNTWLLNKYPAAK